MSKYKLTIYNNMNMWAVDSVVRQDIIFCKINIKDIYFSPTRREHNVTIYEFPGCKDLPVEEIIFTSCVRPGINSLFITAQMFFLYVLYTIHNIDYLVFPEFGLKSASTVLTPVNLSVIKNIIYINFIKQYGSAAILPVYIDKVGKTAFLISELDTYKDTFLKESSCKTNNIIDY